MLASGIEYTIYFYNPNIPADVDYRSVTISAIRSYRRPAHDRGHVGGERGAGACSKCPRRLLRRTFQNRGLVD